MSGAELPELARDGVVHFMGAAGAGMCALAEVVLRSGGRVSGCDLRPGPATERLRQLGAEIEAGHAPDHVDDVAALVVSSAVPPEHPEILRARERGIPVLKRARALGQWVERGTVVAVAGTHGKTSTTAMTTEILDAAGMDPTGFVGGRVERWDGNLRFGRQDLFVVEADEYDRSFHALRPDVAVVTNVEPDHLDVFDDLDGVREAFRTFVGSVSAGGRVVVCGDDPEASRLLAVVGEGGYAYGLNPGLQLRAVDVRHGAAGSSFRVLEEGESRSRVDLRVPGIHHVRNALAAAAVARHLGADWDAVTGGLEGYRGVGRRFEKLGAARGVTVIDDYAHHPTEVRATLEAARGGYPDARLVAVFQPHLFTRTREFHAEFGRALTGADEVWVTDVYPAREEPIPGVTGELVADAARREGGAEVRYHPELEGLAAAVVDSLRPGDVCLTMGAGSVESVGPRILELLEPGTGSGSELAGGERKHA